MKLSIHGTRIFFDIENATADALSADNVQKPTIIALHGGLGFDHGYLKPGLDPMRGVARIVYVDLRGQGQSDRPELETCSLEQMADDVAELINTLGIAQPYIFGHSAGGFVAMTLAVRHPQLVKGLILSGTAASMDRSDVPAGTSDPKLADRAPFYVVSIAQQYYTTPITDETVANFFAAVGPYYAGRDYMGAVSTLLALSNVDVPMLRHFREALVPNYDLRPRLSSIACPTLVMVGTFDWVCPPSAAQEITRSINNAEMVEFSHSGHFLFSEEPGTFQKVLTSFLRKTRKSNAPEIPFGSTI